MNARGGNRIWLIGGALAILALITVTYLLAIKPVYAEIETTRAQTDAAELERSRLTKQLNELKAKYAQRTSYEAQLADKKLQLPDSYDIPDFFRQLQNSDDTVRIDNNSVSVSEPMVVPAMANVVAVPISLNARGDGGNLADLSKFVSRLQNAQSRAVLINSISMQGLDTGAPTLTASLTAFCSKNDENDCRVTTAG